jgi:hypothetical protein
MPKGNRPPDNIAEMDQPLAGDRTKYSVANLCFSVDRKQRRKRERKPTHSYPEKVVDLHTNSMKHDHQNLFSVTDFPEHLS